MAAADDMKEAAMASVDWQTVEITAQRSCADEAFPQGTIDYTVVCEPPPRLYPFPIVLQD